MDGWMESSIVVDGRLRLLPQWTRTRATPPAVITGLKPMRKYIGR